MCSIVVWVVCVRLCVCVVPFVYCIRLVNWNRRTTSQTERRRSRKNKMLHIKPRATLKFQIRYSVVGRVYTVHFAVSTNSVRPWPCGRKKKQWNNIRRTGRRGTLFQHTKHDWNVLRLNGDGIHGTHTHSQRMVSYTSTHTWTRRARFEISSHFFPRRHTMSISVIHGGWCANVCMWQHCRVCVCVYCTCEQATMASPRKFTLQ